MNRRGFIVSVCASGLVGLAALHVGAQGAASGREYVELRTYTCASVEKRDKLLEVFDAALIPALNRLGIERVGVFWSGAEVNDGNGAFATNVFVVIPHPDAASFAACERRLLADAKFVGEAAALFTAPMKEPLFDACSSALLLAFETLPKVKRVSQSPDRLLQLRIYNSYTSERNVKKVSMFEQGGEIGIFRKCGMEPVLFGEALAGNLLPNLTYLLAFDNKEAKEEAWKRFRAHPDWLTLKADPQYKDTANKITNIVLRPSKASQL